MQFFEEQHGEPSNRFKSSSWPSSDCLPTMNMRTGEHLRAGQMPLTLAAKGEASTHSSFKLHEFTRRKRVCPYYCDNKYPNGVKGGGGVGVFIIVVVGGGLFNFQAAAASY